MTKPIDDKLSFKDVQFALQKEVDEGTIFAACPTCKQYLNSKEYKLCKCINCKKINFEDILYYPGAKKDNN